MAMHSVSQQLLSENVFALRFSGLQVQFSNHELNTEPAYRISGQGLNKTWASQKGLEFRSGQKMPKISGWMLVCRTIYLKNQALAINGQLTYSAISIRGFRIRGLKVKIFLILRNTQLDIIESYEKLNQSKDKFC